MAGLRSILLLLMAVSLSTCSFDLSSSCFVDCFPRENCVWTMDAPTESPEEGELYSLTCASTVNIMRIDETSYFTNRKLWCNAKQTGPFWTDIDDYAKVKDLSESEAMELKWHRMKTLHCPTAGEVSCIERAPVLSSCRHGWNKCKEIQMTADSKAIRCTTRQESVFVQLPNKTDVRVDRLICDNTTGTWEGNIYDDPERAHSPGTIRIASPGYNVRCILESAEDVPTGGWVNDKKAADEFWWYKFEAALKALLCTAGCILLTILAIYCWDRFATRHRAYIFEQQSLIPKEERTSWFLRCVDEENFDPASFIPTVSATMPDEDDGKDENEKELVGQLILGTEKDARPPSVAFHDTKEKAKKKKKKKEQITEDQYDSAVAYDKYFLKIDRAEQKIEDFSEDDLEESWRIAQMAEMALNDPDDRPSRGSRFSARNNLMKISSHGGAIGLEARMRASMAEHGDDDVGAGGRIPTRAPSSRGLIDSKAESGPSRGPTGGLLDSRAETGSGADSRGLF